MPNWLFLKKRQNLKLSYAANYRLMRQLLQQKRTDIAYPSQNDTYLAVKNDNNYKTSFHTFEGEPAKILQPVIMEYKRQNCASVILERL